MNTPSITTIARCARGRTSMSWSSRRPITGTILHTMEALRNGKDVYLEKPMTYTVDEAREIADAVQASGRVLQVGSQYTSMDHFWKAKKAIQDGLLGEVVWASGGFGRNRNQRGEWNYAIDPEATDKTLDWKAFLGPAPKRAFDPERYFRWRKYWDYSGGIATDLFYHTVSPLLLSIGGDFPLRVTSSGGIYLQKDREVPDTFFMNVDYPSWTMQLACSVGQRRRRAARDPRQPGHVVRGAEQREPQQHADGNRARPGISRGVHEEDRRRGREGRGAAVRARIAPAHGQFPRLRPITAGAEPSGEARISGDGGDRDGRAGLSPARGAVLRSPA